MRTIAELYRIRDDAEGAAMGWTPWLPTDRLAGRECLGSGGESLVEVEHQIPAHEGWFRRIVRWFTGAAAPVEYRVHGYWPCQIAFSAAPALSLKTTVEPIDTAAARGLAPGASKHAEVTHHQAMMRMHEE